MPIIHKRMRSFSPYRYNIQYARIGEGPIQKPHPYINMAVQPEEHYVLSKKEPHWFAYVVNNIYYESDDECRFNLEKIVSNIIIVDGGKKLSEDFSPSFKRLDVAYQKADVNLKSCEWIDNSVTIRNSFGEYADCFVLGDNKFIKIQKKIMENDIIIKFENGVSANSYEDFKAVIYSVNPHTTDFSVKMIDAENIEHNASNCIYFENAFNTNKVVPVVFNSDGFASTFENPDLTPVRVILKNSNNLIDNGEVNISKAMLYSHDKDTFSATLRYGINTANVSWIDNSAIIKHNINGTVNFIIDDTYDRNPKFTASIVNDSTIKIDFGRINADNPKYEVCNIIVFKVG